MSKPRLLFLMSTLIVGGSEVKIVRIANELASSGSSPEIAFLNPPETLRDRIAKNVLVTHLERRGKYSIKSVRRLASLIDEHDYVLVAVNLYPLLYALPAAKVLASRETRVIGLINTAAQTRNLRLLGHIYAPFLRRCDRIVFGCKSQLLQWTARYRLPVDKCECIYNGVDHEHFAESWCLNTGAEHRERLGIPAQAMVIGSVGRLAPEKNFDLLIAAVAKLNADGRNCYLVLAGEGSERPNLERFAIQLGVAVKVRFLGLLEDVRPTIAMTDVFVLPSKEVETFSNAALEAMAMARPVVLSEIGGAAEMIEHRKSGLLFKIGDLAALCRHLEKLHDSSQLRESLGKAARERVVKLFTFQKMVSFYRDLASN